MESTVGFVGLGLMGTAMTTNLIAAGYDVLGHDPDGQRMTEHRERGGRTAESPGAIAAGAHVVILSLPTSEVGAHVCLGAGGIHEHAIPGSLVIDTTTGRPEDVMTIGTGLQAAGIRYIDATISGNADQTRRRDMSSWSGAMLTPTPTPGRCSGRSHAAATI
ncbi:MAG: hypothetical protein GEU81_18215 [Nitriliruptorales bacterium]|nr:hypothetical protein [Nitriliruptorales bacterium]